MPKYKKVEGFDGYYRVGDDGSVWSRHTFGGNRKDRKVKYGEWKKLHPAPDTSGHLRVNLHCTNKKRQYSVHRLVLEAFVGPCPKNYEACHYPNRDKTDNRLSNLRWASHQDNMFDMIEHGTSMKGERSHKAKLTESDVIAIRKIYTPKGGVTHDELAIMYGVSPITIHYAITGKSWGHLEKNEAATTSTRKIGIPDMTICTREDILRAYEQLPPHEKSAIFAFLRLALMNRDFDHLSGGFVRLVNDVFERNGHQVPIQGVEV